MQPLQLSEDNGKPVAVLIIPEEFDLLREREHFLCAVREGLADAEAGRLVDDEELDSYFDEKFSPLESE